VKVHINFWKSCCCYRAL